MADTPVHGVKTRYGVAASAPTTKAIELLQFGLVGAIQKVRNHGMRGTRSQMKTGVRAGLKTADGPVSLEPRPDELAVLLPFILGGAASGTSYPLAETIPSHVWDYDYESDVLRFSGCYVNRAVFQSSAGSPLQLTLELMCVDWTDDSITFPSISGTYSTGYPFMHHDLTVTVDAVEYKPQSFSLTVDNRLAQIVRNSQTRNHVPAVDRIISCAMGFGASADEQVLYQLTVADIKSIVATYDQGTPAVSLAFTMPYSITSRQTPPAQGRSAEVMRNFQWQAHASAAGDELATVLDSTP